MRPHVVAPTTLNRSASQIPKVFLVAGTRPEAIKLAPVATALSDTGRMRPVIVASGQHPTMVDQVLGAFDLVADRTLDITRSTGSQPELCSQLVTGLDGLLDRLSPSAIVVQGDTTTTLAGALAGFWRRIPVVHLEAGLRSYDLDSPFPEEANRRMVGQIAALHLAPTALAAQNLAAEGVAERDVLTVGNTVVDAALDIARRRAPYSDRRLLDIEASVLRGQRRLLLVTAHRRESWGPPLGRVLRAVADLVDAHPDIDVVLPAHPNPEVRAQVHAALGRMERVTVTEPLPYPDLIRLLSIATLALSDSGGIQEEAPSFQLPVLVLREITERAEALTAGCARLVGTDQGLILREAGRLLTDEAARLDMTACGNPFGDGRAARRTEQALAWLLGVSEDRPVEFVVGDRPRAAIKVA